MRAYLDTHLIDVPVKDNQNHQSKENHMRIVSATQDMPSGTQRTDIVDCETLIDQRQ